MYKNIDIESQESTGIPTVFKISAGVCCWVLLTSVCTGLGAAMGATGAAILNESYENSYDIGTAAIVTALGTSIINGAILVCLLSVECCFNVGCFAASNSRPDVLKASAANAASATLGALLGYSILRPDNMTLGSVAAAAAVGGSIIGAGVACCSSPCSRT